MEEADLLSDILVKLAEYEPNWEELIYQFENTKRYPDRRKRFRSHLSDLSEVQLRYTLEKISLDFENRIIFNPIRETALTENYKLIPHEGRIIVNKSVSNFCTEYDELVLVDESPVLFEVKCDGGGVNKTERLYVKTVRASKSVPKERILLPLREYFKTDDIKYVKVRYGKRGRRKKKPNIMLEHLDDFINKKPSKKVTVVQPRLPLPNKIVYGNELLFDLVDKLSETKMDWIDMENKLKNRPDYQNSVYMPPLKSQIVYIHVKKSLEEICNSYNERVILNPIKDNEVLDKYRFAYNYDGITVLNATKKLDPENPFLNIYSSFSNILLVDNLPVILKIKLNSNDLHYWWNESKIEINLKPFKNYFNTDNLGLVVLIPSNYVSNISPTQKRFKQMGGFIVPLDIDRNRTKVKIEHLHKVLTDPDYNVTMEDILKFEKPISSESKPEIKESELDYTNHGLQPPNNPDWVIICDPNKKKKENPYHFKFHDLEGKWCLPG